MIGVRTDLPAYRAAVGQLARSARLTDVPAGAVCAIGGEEGWRDRAAALLDAGALTLLVADPVAPALADLDELIGRGGSVTLERPRLRPALAVRGDAADAAIITAQCSSAVVRSAELAQDLAGWLRLLTGTPIGIEAAAAAGGAVIASGRSLGGVPVSLTITATTGDGAAIDALVIAERRIELRVDDAAGTRSATRADDDGVTTLNLGYETEARAALRRAMAIAVGDDTSGDLEDLRHDVRIVESVRRISGT